ncbi:MAG: FAD-dependent oxidoreductase, partial [Desulfosarcinaceae bacterium]
LQFDKTFPTLDCAACIGTPKMVEVSQNPNILLYSLSRVTEISGFVGNFTATIRRSPRFVREGVCTGCGECAKVCPVPVANTWDQGMAARRAIGRTFPQAIPITFNIEKKDRAPCTTTCPAGVNIQGYVQLIGQGKYREAVELILQRLPLPGTLGRVCPHPCESQCRRAEVDQPVAIRALKRFAADQVNLADLPLPDIENRDEKVAVIGSGPAGLTAACYLRLKGYRITLFESLDRLGGMLRVGIPDYRLPPQVLDQEIERILSMGVEVRTGQTLGRDFTLDDLASQGFAAVFLGLGAHGSLRLNIPGEDCAHGVEDAITFLREVNLGRRTAPGDRVVVIGGGNVAIDAARTARRLGCSRVTVVYRRTEQEMPAYAEEVEEAREEDIGFHFLTAPLRILEASGKIGGLMCLRTELGPPDADGRRRPVPVEGSEFTLDCDAVIPAIGQKTPMDDLGELAWTDRGRLKVSAATCQTSLPHVFAAGDMASGPASVIQAVGTAHKVVAAMEVWLNRVEQPADIRVPDEDDTPEPDWAPVPEDTAQLARAAESCRPAGQRALDFGEVLMPLSEEQARSEAARCLNCGVCCECMECVKACEAGAIDHLMAPQEMDVQVGSIILATGYDLLDPTPMIPFGYGRFPNVFTSLEFERLSNATGPTGGRILMRGAGGSFEGPPRSVALVHCVGSRDVNYHEYCSRVCCMYALKYSHLIKEKVGHDTPVYDFYIDMRCYGEGYEEFYRRCQEEGTYFIRGKVAEITDQAETPEEEGFLVAVAEDTLMGERVRVPVDMVVLCTAIQAREDAAAVGRVFGVNQGGDGFFLEEHPKLAPLNTATDGVFLAGCCQKPMDIPDTVSQASGAAAKSLSLATRGRVEMQATISAIDPDICVGCRQCIDLCPYGAISFNARKGVSQINP